MDDSREPKSIGEYQRKMERFENTNDLLLLPDMYLVVRVDAHRLGSNWSTLSGYPFNEEFVRALRVCAKDLMSSGFRIGYSFTHGDEISLLLDSLESVNQRKRSRLLSLFASYATAYFNRAFSREAVFHSKMSELPTRSHVLDYFIWQRKVAARNFLTRNIILLLQKQGLDAQQIDQRTSKLSEEERRLMLIDLGFAEDELRTGDLYGYGIWWSDKSSSKPELVGSESLGVTEDEYLQLLEKAAFKPAPLLDEGESVNLRQEVPASYAASSSTTGKPSALPPIQRKAAFRLNDKKS